ncbi:hypothetical protein SNEBB_004126, partial [Seison nebaliae]
MESGPDDFNPKNNLSKIVLEFAKKISVAEKEELLELFHRLSKLFILDNVSDEELQTLRFEIYSYDIHYVINATIINLISRHSTDFDKYEFLVNLFVVSTKSLHRSTDNDEAFSQQLMSSFVLNCIGVLREMSSDRLSKQMILKMKESIESVVIEFPQSIQLTLINDDIMYLLILSIPTPITIHIMKLILSLAFHHSQMNFDKLFNQSYDQFFRFIDEIIYKLSKTKDRTIAKYAIDILVHICDVYKLIIPSFKSRYKGIKNLMKSWDDESLMNVLEKKERDQKKKKQEIFNISTISFDSTPENISAVTIQRNWRGYQTRKRLKAADKAFGRFQRSFRQKLIEKQRKKDLENEKIRKEFEEFIQNRRKFRNFKLKEYDLIHHLPSECLKENRMTEQKLAAIQIQKAYRGYRQRKKYLNDKKRMKEEKAFEFFRKKIRSKVQYRREKKLMAEYDDEPLTSSQQEILLDQIANWRMENKGTNCLTNQELEEEFDSMQDDLDKWRMSRENNIQHRINIRRMIVHMKTDMTLLSDCPMTIQQMEETNNLDEVNKLLISSSSAIRQKSKQRTEKLLKQNEMTHWASPYLQISNGFFSNLLRKKHSQSYRIGAFNIRIFGLSKLKNEKVLEGLIEIVDRYDLLFVQEIRDKTERTIPKFLESLNENVEGKTYNYVISSRIGRTRSKEQYAFIYDENKIGIIDQFEYCDGEEKLIEKKWLDQFHREPFVIKFQFKNFDSIPKFAFIGIHTDPDEAKEEIVSLFEVAESVDKKWSLENVIIGGDMNADCSYFNYKKFDLPHPFQSIIPSDADTTTTRTHCAYDRFFIKGDMVNNFLEMSGTYNFDEIFKLNSTQALAISDHRPIEMILNIEEDLNAFDRLMN